MSKPTAMIAAATLAMMYVFSNEPRLILVKAQDMTSMKPIDPAITRSVTGQDSWANMREIVAYER